MDTLRDDFSIKSVEIRKALGVAPATLNDMYKRANISYVDADNSSRGAAKAISSMDVRKLFEIRGYQYPTPAQVISFMMCKGGVGKTTSTLFVAQRLAHYGARVLAIDADSQGNLTSGFDLEKYGPDLAIDEETAILTDVLDNRIDIEEAIIAIAPGLHLIPSTPLNANLDAVIRDKHKNFSTALKKYLDPLKQKYDFILIDCAPALNLTNTATVSASDIVVLPVAPDKFSQLGLEQTLQEIKTIQSDFPDVHVSPRIVFTKFDAREYTSMKYLGEIAEKYKEILFQAMIRTSADVKNAITKKEDLFSYKKSNARDDYDALAREVMGIDAILSKKAQRRLEA